MGYDIAFGTWCFDVIVLTMKSGIFTTHSGIFDDSICLSIENGKYWPLTVEDIEQQEWGYLMIFGFVLFGFVLKTSISYSPLYPFFRHGKHHSIWGYTILGQAYVRLRHWFRIISCKTRSLGTCGLIHCLTIRGRYFVQNYFVKEWFLTMWCLLVKRFDFMLPLVLSNFWAIPMMLMTNLCLGLCLCLCLCLILMVAVLLWW